MSNSWLCQSSSWFIGNIEWPGLLLLKSSSWSLIAYLEPWWQTDNKVPTLSEKSVKNGRPLTIWTSVGNRNVKTRGTVKQMIKKIL